MHPKEPPLPLSRPHARFVAGTRLFLGGEPPGTFETIGFTQIYNMMDGDDRAPGDFGFDPLGLLPGNEEQYKTAELTHGRAAMLAFSAVATQSALPAAFGFGKVRRARHTCPRQRARPSRLRPIPPLAGDLPVLLSMLGSLLRSPQIGSADGPGDAGRAWWV